MRMCLTPSARAMCCSLDSVEQACCRRSQVITVDRPALRCFAGEPLHQLAGKCLVGAQAEQNREATAMATPPSGSCDLAKTVRDFGIGADIDFLAIDLERHGPQYAGSYV